MPGSDATPELDTAPGATSEPRGTPAAGPPTEVILREVARRISTNLGPIAAEMIKEVQEQIPEYARPGDPAYARTVRLGVDAALRRFLDVLSDVAGPPRSAGNADEWRELFLAIGAGEQHEGRSLDTLQTAMRLCARLGWRHLVDFVTDEGASLTTLGALAEIIFSYLDQIADASAAGYARAQATAAGELDRRRRRLLELLLTDPPVSADALAAAARAAHWRVPRLLSAVAIEPRSALGTPPLFAPEILVSFDRAEPCLVVPDPERPAQERALIRAMAPFRTAVGPPVPPPSAPKSLRWARDALALARRGALSEERIVWCRDHLAALAVFRDEDLLAVLVERRLAPLSDLRPGPRALLSDTLLAWLQLDRNAGAVAARLHVHPQTVRYRLRQLDRLFGADLRDPSQRFELEVALRADLASRRAAAPGSAIEDDLDPDDEVPGVGPAD